MYHNIFIYDIPINQPYNMHSHMCHKEEGEQYRFYCNTCVSLLLVQGCRDNEDIYTTPPHFSKSGGGKTMFCPPTAHFFFKCYQGSRICFCLWFFERYRNLRYTNRNLRYTTINFWCMGIHDEFVTILKCWADYDGQYMLFLWKETPFTV